MKEQQTFFVGADVSKAKIDFCFLANQEKYKPKFVSIPNDSETIKAYFSQFLNDDIMIAFEHTSNYHLPLQSALSELKLKFSALNPAKTSHFLKHLTYQKSDISDAYGLALYCKIFKADLNPSLHNPDYIKIKSYNSTLDLLSKIQTQLKNFKQAQSYIKNQDIDTAISTLTDTIKHLKQKLKLQAYELVKSFVPNCDKIIKTNKGFGIDLALNLFPQLHFNRAKSEKQFISFLGLSPRIYQSGSSVSKQPRINKRGSSLIVTALKGGTFNGVKFDEVYVIDMAEITLS